MVTTHPDRRPDRSTATIAIRTPSATSSCRRRPATALDGVRAKQRSRAHHAHQPRDEQQQGRGMIVTRRHRLTVAGRVARADRRDGGALADEAEQAGEHQQQEHVHARGRAPEPRVPPRQPVPRPRRRQPARPSQRGEAVRIADVGAGEGRRRVGLVPHPGGGRGQSQQVGKVVGRGTGRHPRGRRSPSGGAARRAGARARAPTARARVSGDASSPGQRSANRA